MCGRDTCNGPSLPPREMIEEAHDIIDVDEVVKSLQAEWVTGYITMIQFC